MTVFELGVMRPKLPRPRNAGRSAPRVGVCQGCSRGAAGRRTDGDGLQRAKGTMGMVELGQAAWHYTVQ